MIPIAALLPVIDAALLLVEKVTPHIKEAFARGEISAEDQQKLLDRINKLKESGFAFTRPDPGPEPEVRKTVRDAGGTEYELVHPATEGRVAVYERIPRDPDHTYTPDLGFALGHTTVPIMHRMDR